MREIKKKYKKKKDSVDERERKEGRNVKIWKGGRQKGGKCGKKEAVEERARKEERKV